MAFFRLFVDDTRQYPDNGYECCCTVGQATFLLGIIPFDYITLDYSLSDHETGMEILIYMKENNILVPNINIHSNNIFGREEMFKYCKQNFPDSKITMNMLPK